MSRTFVGMPAFPEAARAALGDTQLRHNLAHATGVIRAKRAGVVAELEHAGIWEDLRLAGAAVKQRALDDLATHLETLERTLTAAGAVVHWARDAAEANAVVAEVARAHGADEVVKVKSMATQEIGLNEALEAEGVAAWETDLAELIVQLGEDLPSHILVPAIHRNRAEIREIFLRRMADVGRPAPADLTDDPAVLAGAAREHLREKFLRARVGVSGANFAVAETGTLVVVESEGNGRMCLTLPEVLISVVGIEKVVPTWGELDPLLRLLPRSATGERMNPYTSTWSGRTPGDGPQEVHVVLLDNGRTRALADDTGRQALRCIRCSACLNVCPVYERTGGHAYGSVYPGPIGAILNPLLHGTGDEQTDSLPYASTLCGACFEACPVRIDIPEVLVHLRSEVVDAHRGDRLPSAEALAMRAAGWAFADASRLGRVEKAAGLSGRVLSRLSRTTLPGGRSGVGRLPGPGAAAWTGARDLPTPPAESFRAWWARTDGGRTEGGEVQGRGAAGAVSQQPDPVAERLPAHRSPAAAAPAVAPRASAAREEILGRVRAALAEVEPTPTPVEAPRMRHGDASQVLDLFADRVADYRAVVERVAAADLADHLAGLFAPTDRVVVPDGLGEDLLSRLAAQAQLVRDDALTAADLDAVDAVVTTATVGIAETGTIVLDHGPGQGRRALSLVPDRHVCVVRADQVVPDVPDAVHRLAAAVREGRALTWISGPSATSDIELDRVEGVHGPRRLHVLLVD
ncbi:Lactate utilization protein B [Nocardioides dokdonensis FR1436]|uniref:Lactate utilization protein B n=1 Tax=Nocardioides dokdonensis FR1436 TaxID=1300347 RepID=A0A1A9GKC0_9ACTN|nr:LUD domain-containing protein [Nocardioides dokdonensis]ANH37931.1 Lactate utilization protein B [Nocardioides dokdonensis FR1436]